MRKNITASMRSASTEFSSSVDDVLVGVEKIRAEALKTGEKIGSLEAIGRFSTFLATGQGDPKMVYELSVAFLTTLKKWGAQSFTPLMPDHIDTLVKELTDCWLNSSKIRS